VVFPLIFASLITGIAGHGDLKSLGKLALKSFIYFEIATTIALALGLLCVNLVKPGGSHVGEHTSYNSSSGSHSVFTYEVWINHLTPKTWAEMLSGELLQVPLSFLVI
jgi:proton glutamate symport protein